MNRIEQNLSLVESWLDKKGFVLCKSKKSTIQDEVDFERKVVFLSLRSSPINQLYSVLHECGHIIIRGRKDYQIRYKGHYQTSEGYSRPTLRSNVELVEEEINAWREGENLCKKLSITLDRDKYYRYGFRWVMSYIVLAGIGNEHLLSNSIPLETETVTKQTNKNIDLRALLDNAHDSCYSKVIAEPEQR